MTILDVFTTFGLPAIALAGALFALHVTTRSSERLRKQLDGDKTASR